MGAKTIQVGHQFGRLTVVQKDIDRMKKEKELGKKGVPTYWLCRCDCPDAIIVSVSTSALNRGATKSCGCLRREKVAEYNKTKSADVRITNEYGEELKLCVKCGLHKPIHQFHKQGRTTHRLQNWCKECNTNRVKTKETFCHTCGKPINVEPDRSNRPSTNHYCGKKCRAIAMSKIRKGKTPNISNEQWVEISRKAKIRYSIKENHPMWGKHHSQETRNKLSEVHKERARKGHKPPNYQPNKANDTRVKERSIDGYSEWRAEVYKRDNYACQCCGKQSEGDIVAHHLDGYNWCVEKRTDVDNGVTLCTRCHSLFHKKHGKGNNTREQWNDFLNSWQQGGER